MYRARDQIENEDWLDVIDQAADDLDLDSRARSVAVDLFLSATPDADRSKPAIVAAALYAGALVAGEERPQTVVAEAVGVSRLAVQTRWKDLIETVGFDAPDW